MNTCISERTEAAVDMVRRAGIEARSGFRAQAGSSHAMKGPQDYLTETDLAVEHLLKSDLARHFPNDGFLGEETGGAVSGNFWVVDPIDGTANFARGIAHYAVCMAFVADGTVQLAVTYNPELDEMYVATSGGGATRNRQVIRVADTAAMSAASVEIGWSHRRRNAPYLASVAAVLDAGANVRRASSGALGLAFVADGRSDGYAELHMNAWDCLGGLLMVREAGGVVGGTALAPDLAEGGSVLAVAPGIAAEVSAAVDIPTG